MNNIFYCFKDSFFFWANFTQQFQQQSAVKRLYIIVLGFLFEVSFLIHLVSTYLSDIALIKKIFNILFSDSKFKKTHLFHIPKIFLMRLNDIFKPPIVRCILNKNPQGGDFFGINQLTDELVGGKYLVADLGQFCSPYIAISWSKFDVVDDQISFELGPGE